MKKKPSPRQTSKDPSILSPFSPAFGLVILANAGCYIALLASAPPDWLHLAGFVGFFVFSASIVISSPFFLDPARAEKRCPKCGHVMHNINEPIEDHEDIAINRVCHHCNHWEVA